MTSMSEQRSSAAVGWTTFAAIMLIMIGAFHAIAGLAGIIDDDFYRVLPAAGTETTGDVYFLEFDTTTWGWIHLIGGVIVLLAGFAWIPYYPVWSITIITIDITVIWALTAHGRHRQIGIARCDGRSAWRRSSSGIWREKAMYGGMS